MIKSNELRTGNKLIIRSLEHVGDRATGLCLSSEIEVFAIIKHPIGAPNKLAVIMYKDGEYIKEQFLNDEVRGILLTPEWLERCGLPNDLSTLNAGGNFSLIFERRGDDLFLVSSSAMESEVIRQVEHLHLFQNLYLDLTGQELTIKETV